VTPLDLDYPGRAELLAEATNGTFFGVRLGDLSRDDLLVALAYAVRRERAQAEIRIDEWRTFAALRSARDRLRP